jgi:hypothetical protein
VSTRSLPLPVLTNTTYERPSNADYTPGSNGSQGYTRLNLAAVPKENDSWCIPQITRLDWLDLSLRILEERIINFDAESYGENTRLLRLLTIPGQYGAVRHQRALSVAVIGKPLRVL